MGRDVAVGLDLARGGSGYAEFYRTLVIEQRAMSLGELGAYVYIIFSSFRGHLVSVWIGSEPLGARISDNRYGVDRLGVFAQVVCDERGQAGLGIFVESLKQSHSESVADG